MDTPHLITFPASTDRCSAIQTAWGCFDTQEDTGRLFVLEPTEASCIAIHEHISGYNIAICQGDKKQCQGWINRHYQLPPEDFFHLETTGHAHCWHYKSSRLVIIWLKVPARENAVCVFGLMAHEALHATYAIQDGMGMSPAFSNEEFTAYTVQFLMNCYAQSIGLPIPIGS